MTTLRRRFRKGEPHPDRDLLRLEKRRPPRLKPGIYLEKIICPACELLYLATERGQGCVHCNTPPGDGIREGTRKMITPYFNNQWVTIYHGDNREILAGMEDDTAIATVADPPYEVQLNPETCPWDKWPADWSQIYRVSAEYLVLSIAPHVAHARIPDVLRAGWNVLEVGAWIYGSGRPVRKDRLKRSYDSIFYLSKSSRSLFTENGRGHYRAGKASGKKNSAVVNRTGGKIGHAFGIWQPDSKYEYRETYHPANVACEVGCEAFGDSGYEMIFAVKRVRSSKDKDEKHPTEKPLDLIAQQIKLVSNPGDTILDHFMGSGTTLRAAVNLGRRAIGIEQDEVYCELAARRLEEPLLDWGNGKVAPLSQAGFDFDNRG